MSQQIRFGSSQGHLGYISAANTHDKRHFHSHHQRFTHRGEEFLAAGRYNHLLASPSGGNGHGSNDFMTSYPVMSKFKSNADQGGSSMFSPPPSLPSPYVNHSPFETGDTPIDATAVGHHEEQRHNQQNKGSEVSSEESHFRCDHDSDADEGLEDPGQEPAPAELMHLKMVKREQERTLMRNLYHEGKTLPKSLDLTSSLKRSLKGKIFPKVKLLLDREHQYLAPDFIGDDCNDQSRLIAEILLEDLCLARTLEYKVMFWITYRSLIKNQLVKYRSNCVEEMKNVYLKARSVISDDTNRSANPVAGASALPYPSHMEGAMQLIDLATHSGEKDGNLLRIRESQNKEAFFYFARELLPCVTKRLVFRQNKFVRRLSEFVSVSDEAFALLTLENNVARWNAMFEKNVTKCDETMPLQKFQSIPKNKGKTLYKNMGINTQNHDSFAGGQDDNNDNLGSTTPPAAGAVLSKDGYGYQAAVRYNEYYDYVSCARKDETRTVLLEQSLMAQIERLHGTAKKNFIGGNKRMRDGELNYVNEQGQPLKIRCDLRNDLSHKGSSGTF